MRQQRPIFPVKQNFTVVNHLTNEVITGDLINEDEIEGKKFYVMRINGRVLKLAKEAYMPKKHLIPR
jgi:hypothetical protein